MADIPRNRQLAGKWSPHFHLSVGNRAHERTRINKHLPLPSQAPLDSQVRTSFIQLFGVLSSPCQPPLLPSNDDPNISIL